MGGYGSGRPSTRTCGRVEDSRPLDIGKLRRGGVLAEGWAGKYHWHLNGKEIAQICLRMRPGVLLLNYSFSRGNGPKEAVEQSVPLVWRSCRFGGQRLYFQCRGVINGKVCQRCVTKLYGAGKFFLCRFCYRLSFSSQHEDRWDRSLRRANRIRSKLGGAPGLNAPLAPRPKHMRQRTYDRLFDEIMNLEARAEERLAMFAAKLLDIGSKPSRSTGSRKGFWK